MFLAIFLEWISVSEAQRLMHVRVSNVLSPSRQVTSRVQHGSVGGHLLFLMYINHVVSGFSCRFKIFAEYVILYLARENTSHSTMMCLFCREIYIYLLVKQLLGDLEMNVDKCVDLKFGPKSSILTVPGDSRYKVVTVISDWSSLHSDLGVMADPNLKFMLMSEDLRQLQRGLQQISLVVPCVGTLIFLRTLLSSMSTQPNSVSKLEYGCQLWNVG